MPTESQIVDMLCSRRNGPTYLDDDTKFFKRTPYDPTSDHWQRFSRLEYFHTYVIDLELDFMDDDLCGELGTMVVETKVIHSGCYSYKLTWQSLSLVVNSILLRLVSNWLGLGQDFEAAILHPRRRKKGYWPPNQKPRSMYTDITAAGSSV